MTSHRSLYCTIHGHQSRHACAQAVMYQYSTLLSACSTLAYASCSGL